MADDNVLTTASPSYQHYAFNTAYNTLKAKARDNDTSTSIRAEILALIAKLDCTYSDYATIIDRNSHTTKPRRCLYPIGPYSLRLWYPGDDIHFVCLTDNSASTFWSYIAEKLDREDLPRHDCVVSELSRGGKVWLHYCPVPKHSDSVAPWRPVLLRPSKNVQQSTPAIQSLRDLHDTRRLIEFVGKAAPVFRRAYNALREFLISAGLYTTKFGMLNADSLLWMLFRAVPSVLPEEADDARTLVKHFVATYSNFRSLKLVHTPNGRRVFTPLPDIEDDIGVRITSVLWSANRHAGHLKDTAVYQLQQVIDAHWAIALISVECWAPKQHSHFHKQLVQGLARLPKAIHDSKLTCGAITIWPNPFRTSKDEWIYLVGIEERLSGAGQGDILDHVDMKGRFPGSAKQHDAEGSGSQDPQPHQDLVKLLEWYDFGVDTVVGQASARLCSPSEARDLLAKYGAPSLVPIATKSLATLDPARLASNKPSKFPAAAQALSRLRWDPAHAVRSYEVGYLDRFKGLIWLPLEQWGKATEADDFVPEHRIRVLKRVGDGKIVWDREERFCEF